MAQRQLVLPEVSSKNCRRDVHDLISSVFGPVQECPPAKLQLRTAITTLLVRTTRLAHNEDDVLKWLRTASWALAVSEMRQSVKNLPTLALDWICAEVRHLLNLIFNLMSIFHGENNIRLPGTILKKGPTQSCLVLNSFPAAPGWRWSRYQHRIEANTTFSEN